MNIMYQQIYQQKDWISIDDNKHQWTEKRPREKILALFQSTQRQRINMKSQQNKDYNRRLQMSLETKKASSRVTLKLA